MSPTGTVLEVRTERTLPTERYLGLKVYVLKLAIGIHATVNKGLLNRLSA